MARFLQANSPFSFPLLSLSFLSSASALSLSLSFELPNESSNYSSNLMDANPIVEGQKEPKQGKSESTREGRLDLL